MTLPIAVMLFEPMLFEPMHQGDRNGPIFICDDTNENADMFLVYWYDLVGSLIHSIHYTKK